MVRLHRDKLDELGALIGSSPRPRPQSRPSARPGIPATRPAPAATVARPGIPATRPSPVAAQFGARPFVPAVRPAPQATAQKSPFAQAQLALQEAARRPVAPAPMPVRPTMIDRLMQLAAEQRRLTEA